MLWKRGFIDAMKLKNYQIKVIDGDGKVIPQLSLEHIIENYHNFLNEKFHFEYDCQQLGTRALIMTKYHAELNEEGIEYIGAFQSLSTVGPHFK